ncbi:hypothetical protein [Paraurantiacibacter namhicola]|uniref:Sodium:proline symporter n=1 Tax=Paraurantiacibacter namhicola TaxID=645517 RepID=A0A1C7D8P9_9SPHN|nr:hypothetical protein [Paraurantiacibacter namhicola]ANU07817.1 hypothetical protein A6F65_01514 [Paraurantiacibacter namhicola]
MTQAGFKTGAMAGLVAGAIFLAVELVMVPLVLGGALWGPPRMMAAIAMGDGVLPPPATFDAGIVLVGMLVHFALSAVLGVVFAAMAKAMNLSGTKAIVAGAVFGLLVYLVNFYGLTAVFPWFEMARNWVTIFAHLVFGGVLGWYYRSPAAAR